MNVLHLANIRFKKTMRQPFTIILILFNLAIVALTSALPFFTFVKSLELKMFLDISIASTFIISSVITIYFASTSIINEINDRTIFAIFSKTVSKLSYLSGNFLGLIYISVVLYLITTILADFTYSYNHFKLFYLKSGNVGLFEYISIYFTDIFGGTINFSEREFLLKENTPESLNLSLFMPVFKFFIVSFLNSLFMISISVALSPFIPFGVNLICCLCIFSLGSLEGFLSSKVPFISKVVYTLVPRMDLFNASDAITLNVNFNAMFLGKLFIYAIIYSCFIIFLSSKFLERKEFI